MDHVVINVFFCVSENSDPDFSRDEYSNNTLNGLREELSILLRKYKNELNFSHTIFLNKEKYSIHHCDTCGNLMVDRTENPIKFDRELDVLFHDIEIIYDGAHLGDSFLCSRCLPPNHRWSWE